MPRKINGFGSDATFYTFDEVSSELGLEVKTVVRAVEENKLQVMWSNADGHLVPLIRRFHLQAIADYAEMRNIHRKLVGSELEKARMEYANIKGDSISIGLASRVLGISEAHVEMFIKEGGSKVRVIDGNRLIYKTEVDYLLDRKAKTGTYEQQNTNIRGRVNA